MTALHAKSFCVSTDALHKDVVGMARRSLLQAARPTCTIPGDTLIRGSLCQWDS